MWYSGCVPCGSTGCGTLGAYLLVVLDVVPCSSTGCGTLGAYLLVVLGAYLLVVLDVVPCGSTGCGALGAYLLVVLDVVLQDDSVGLSRRVPLQTDGVLAGVLLTDGEHLRRSCENKRRQTREKSICPRLATTGGGATQHSTPSSSDKRLIHSQPARVGSPI